MANPLSDPTWVLLRGLMREARHWGDFPALFGAAFPAAAIVTPDLPGNGLLFRSRSPTSIGAMVESCRAALAIAGHAPPYRLLALSLGGMVATEWARRHPAEIDALVLINTSMRPFSPFHQRLRPRNYGSLLSALLLPGSAVKRETAILDLVSNHAPRRHAALPRWVALAKQCPVSRGNGMRQLLAAARFRGPPDGVAPPVLLLAANGDRLVDPACSSALARSWGAPLMLHQDAGHDLPQDDGAWVAASVRRWLDRPQRLSGGVAAPSGLLDAR